MARVEAADMTAHRNNAGFLGDLRQVLGIFDRDRHRDFDQHMLAGAHHLFALREVHLGRRGEDHRVGTLDAFGKVARVVRNAVLLGNFCSRVLITADKRRDFNAIDTLERIQVLLAEGTLPSYANLHYLLENRSYLRTLDFFTSVFAVRGSAA